MSAGRAWWAVAAVLAGGAAAACGGAPGPEESAASRATGCVTCHAEEYRKAPHHVGERPTACGVCHGQSAWKPTWVDHEWWALTGKHETTRCFDCHKGEPPVFAGTKKECFACHEAEYAKAPGHAGKFPTTCGECHSTEAWKPRLPGHEKRDLEEEREDAGSDGEGEAKPEDAGAKGASKSGGKPKGKGTPKGTPTPVQGPTPTPTPVPVPTPTPTTVPTAKPPPDTITTPSRRFGGRR